MTKSFEDYAKEAEARAEEQQRLGLTTYDEIQQHYAARSCWATTIANAIPALGARPKSI